MALKEEDVACVHLEEKVADPRVMPSRDSWRMLDRSSRGQGTLMPRQERVANGTMHVRDFSYWIGTAKGLAIL